MKGIRLIQADITTLSVDAIVNAANSSLLGGGGVDGCADVSEFPNITAEMLKRGYSEEEIRKVWGGNFFRVFAEVEKLAQKN